MGKKVLNLDKAKEKTFQTTVRLPESLHRAFKAKCAIEGRKITEALEALIKEYVGKE